MERLVERLLRRPFRAPDGDGNAGIAVADTGNTQISDNTIVDTANQQQAETQVEKSTKSPPSEALVEALTTGLEGEAAEFAKRFASKKDLVNAAIELRKLNGSMVRVPKDDSKPEQIAAFRKAIGAPESLDGYFDIKDENEFSAEDRAFQSKVAAVLHKHHAPVTMAAELQALVGEVAEANQAEQERVAVKFREDSEAALRRELGADFDGFIEGARRVRDALGTPGLTELLNTEINGKKLGDHPDLIRVFGMWGKRSGETELLGATSATEIQSLSDKHADLTRQMHAALAKNDRQLAARLDQERSAISERLVGSEPIVGSMGRTA